MRRSNATTLQDIAQEAGVTAMAVSVVLNGSTSSTRVSASTRERILDAASRLRYRPNAVARGLSRRCMDTIGVAAIVDGGDVNLYFLELLNGVLEEAARQGQNTTIFSIDNWTDESRILRALDGRVDGMVLIAPDRLTPTFATLLHQHTPYVTIHGNYAPPPAYNLEVDNVAGGYLMTKHMLDLGHRRIAHFMGMVGMRGTDLRLAGYRKALAEADVEADESLIFPGWYTISSGRELAELLLARKDQPLPTAIFCANDGVATGCMEVLQRNGLSIPGDVSVGGFDGILSAGRTMPQLTTIQQPFRQMGHRAVKYLLSQIRAGANPLSGTNPGSLETAEETFPVELLVRGTVATPPTHPIFPPQ